MQAILHAYWTRVFIPVTAGFLFTIIFFVAGFVNDSKDRAIVLMLVGYCWYLLLSIILVFINFILLRLINPSFDDQIRNDFISAVYIFISLYFFIISEDNLFRASAIFFILTNLAVIFYCKKKKIM